MITRKIYLQEIQALFEVFPVVALLGPRQCGKSTLAQQYRHTATLETHLFDLESEQDLSKLQEAELTLENLNGLIIIDEIQRKPELFPTLRYLVDYKPQKYLILGSASRDLIRQSSETLAGRIAYLELPPFGLNEYEMLLEDLWSRGGFPRSILASNQSASYRWRQEYIRTFLERDLAFMGFHLNPALASRLWKMLAHYHGQTLNITELATNLNVTQKTINHYIDVLEGTFMVRKLQPWFTNLKKRQVKSPKIYIRDAGILHRLLGQKTIEDITAHPKLGASWEGFAIEELIKALQPDETYFWRTSNDAELDLLIIKEGKMHGFEFKYSYTPKITPSIRIAQHDLQLPHLTIIIPRGTAYRLSDTVSVCGLREFIVQFPLYA